MEVFQGFQTVVTPFRKPVLTIGNFDGVHLGHQRIIRKVVEKAREINGTSVVYTFRPHPQAVLSPTRDVSLITTYEEKLELLRDLGVNAVIEEPFSRAFSTFSAEDFFKTVLLEQLKVQFIIIGFNFGFGKGRSGSLDVLQEFCDANGVHLEVVHPENLTPESSTKAVCSSSRIRGLLKEGDIESANHLLGRPFSYKGIVVRGDGRGRKIGFPTANVSLPHGPAGGSAGAPAFSKIQVKTGVYVSETWFQGTRIFSITNVGKRPTFVDGLEAPVLIETHLLDFEGDLYGHPVEVKLLKKLRDELKFSGIETLVEQIQKDIKEAKNIHNIS